MKKSLYFIFSAIAIVFYSCEQVQKVADVVIKPTAREKYERDFANNDSLYIKWNIAFEKAKNDSLQILMPYSEGGIFSSEENLVYSYDLQLKEGEKIFIEVNKQTDSLQVFIDFFKKEKDSNSIKSLRFIKSAETDTAFLSSEVDSSSEYKIIIQPQLGVEFPFQLKIYVQPTYIFPVSGGTNRDVGSFWADPRDGGKRSHEGVDIFADKGTPLVAVTDGIIADTGERGLGGKQVWLRDGLFGKSIYYAHLDSIGTTTGKKVKAGDTIGFVGNTGNAKTTPPHVHFGIYKGSVGAINPYPFIKQTEIQKVDTSIEFNKAIVSRNRTEVAKASISGFKILGNLKKNDTISILGKSEDFFHIQSKSGLKGFISDKTVKPLPSY